MLRSLWRTACDLLREVYKRFWEHDLPLMAAALSYYGFLALIPLLLLFLSIAGFALRSAEPDYGRIAQALEVLLPESPEVIIGHLRSVVGNWGLAGGIGLVGLVWLSLAIFDVMERVLNRVWHVEKRRPYLKRKGVALLLMVVSGLFFVCSMLLTSLSAARAHGFSIGGLELVGLGNLWGAASMVVPVLLSTMMFLLIYDLLPNRRVQPLPALLGAILAAACWELTKSVFHWWLGSFHSYARIYGSLAGIAILVVWIYLSAMVLLIGAEVAAACEHLSQRNADGP